jgi:hypothetical protein
LGLQTPFCFAAFLHRAVRAQQFVAFTRRDMAARRAKAAELERKVYPETTKKLSKEEYEAFFDRVLADTARRLQHRWDTLPCHPQAVLLSNARPAGQRPDDWRCLLGGASIFPAKLEATE